jgi:glycosyltransferase involved in cell wall biosynthesis
MTVPMTLAMPLGNSHGWGVCGSNLARELARLGTLRLVTPSMQPEAVGDEFEYSVLRELHLDAAAQEHFRAEIARSVVLQAATDHHLQPMAPHIRGRRNVAYTFFESTVLSPQRMEEAKRNFDVVIAGSTWCRDLLRAHGLAGARAIFQGVDRTIFHPHENQKTFFEDRFVLFSGGKLEFRKGQDLVIRAFRVLQERHDDVLLVNAWFNFWESSWRTMAASPHIRFVYEGADHCAAVNGLLAENGIDLEGVITLPAKPNVAMARIYRNSDCGLFPNRCEGGTNLALMEYMACGKPAIASYSSGHRDVANERNAVLLKRLAPLPVSAGDQLFAQWDEPDLEEIVEALEWAYANRDALRRLGSAAGESMQAFSWGAAARQFYEVLGAA